MTGTHSKAIKRMTKSIDLTVYRHGGQGAYEGLGFVRVYIRLIPALPLHFPNPAWRPSCWHDSRMVD